MTNAEPAHTSTPATTRTQITARTVLPLSRPWVGVHLVEDLAELSEDQPVAGVLSGRGRKLGDEYRPAPCLAPQPNGRSEASPPTGAVALGRRAPHSEPYTHICSIASGTVSVRSGCEFDAHPGRADHRNPQERRPP